MTKDGDLKKDDDIKMKSPSSASLLRRYSLTLALLALLTLLALTVSLAGTKPNLFCSLHPPIAADYQTTPSQLLAILHYATTKDIPQQTNAEVRLTFEVLNSLSPCNFLVYGVGRDSLMWHSLNPRGTTLFLEEDANWLRSVLQTSPVLDAHAVTYRTRLDQADNLIASYRSEPDCLPSAAPLSRESRCPLALTQLPEEVYARDWDIIMVDAPRGYFPSAPGRMAAIYSAAVMARGRRSAGVTHVFVHDVNRRVERMYAEEFLCEKYKVEAVGRLWHFAIPPGANISGGAASSFCSD